MRDVQLKDDVSANKNNSLAPKNSIMARSTGSISLVAESTQKIRKVKLVKTIPKLSQMVPNNKIENMA